MTETIIIKELMNKLWARYDFASILRAESTGKVYSVSASGIVANRYALYCQNGYVVKIFHNGIFCEYSFNELSSDNIDALVAEIDGLYAQRKAIEACFETNTYKMPEEEDIKKFTENEMHLNPEETSDEEIIAKLDEIRSYAMSLDSRLLDCAVRAQYQVYDKYYLSPHKELSQKVLWMCGTYMMLAKKDSAVKSVYNAYSNKDGMAVLDRMKDGVRAAVDNVIALLDAETIVPGEYECICTPEVTGMIVHEAFGHGVEMDMFVKDRALAKNYIGKQVASELVTMHDGATAADEVATFDFDDEGVAGSDTIVIEKGILKTGMCDSLSAQALGISPTGNGRRENYERKAYTRMTNTFFEGGTDKVEDMIASIKHGYLLENPTSGMEDPKNWGIQCMVNSAKEIVDGKLTGKIYSPIILSGYVPDLLKSITMMSENVELCGSGACGKGYKEFVKVSDGGPYIKARVKIG